MLKDIKFILKVELIDKIFKSFGLINESFL